MTAGVVLALGLAARPAPAPAARADLWAQLTASASGASDPYLRPGLTEPELIGLVEPRLGASWRGERAWVSAGYGLLLTRFVATEVTGVGHDGYVLGGVVPAPGWRVHLGLEGELADYDGTGPAADTGTLPLLATAARAGGVGGGIRWTDGDLAAGADWLTTWRRTEAVSPDAAASEAVRDTVHEGAAHVAWWPAAGVRVRAGPVFTRRLATPAYLGFLGWGGLADARARTGPWEVETWLRAQENTFDDPAARDDLYVRWGVAVSLDGGAVRWTLGYAYTANGSRLAAYDADRHLLTVGLRWRVPLVEGRP